MATIFIVGAHDPVFHQFFDQTSSALTYLLADPSAVRCGHHHSVKEHLGAYLTFLQEQELQLAWVLETHVHADHVTGAAGLREMTGARSAVGAVGGVGCADRQLATATPSSSAARSSASSPPGAHAGLRHLPLARPPVLPATPDDRRLRAGPTSRGRRRPAL